MTRRHVLTVMVAGSLLLASCGNGEETIPSAEQLSDMLISADDVEGDWSLFDGPQGGDQMIDPSGILTDEQRELVPSFELCDRASDEAKQVADDLRPVVFRQMDLAVDDEIDPPSDREGHMVFLQQSLFAGDPDELADSFTIVRDELRACLGPIPAGEEGPGFAEELTVPEVGDDRFAALITIEEAGGWAEWRVHEIFVRQGPVVMLLVIVDIRAGVDPYFSTSDIDDIVRTAAEKL